MVGVSGGIAAYKACEVISRLQKTGASITVVMTEHAHKFITPLTLGSLARGQVLSDLFAEKPGGITHINVAQEADIIVVVPATANILAKAAHGIADDLLSTILLATSAPVFFAPAMNVKMYQHPATQDNIKTLKSRDCKFIEPATGVLACGDIGPGRLAQIDDIIIAIENILMPVHDYAGKHVMVTAGCTHEQIDPVRYLANHSSGKMGYAIAKAARDRGAKVTLISGPTALDKPDGVEVIAITSAQQMYDAVLKIFPQTDIVIKAAAVADYRLQNPASYKIKKENECLTLQLIKNPDILKELGARKESHQLLVGFAAETNQVEDYARKKLLDKNLDAIVANDVAVPGIGFGSDDNSVTIFLKDGTKTELPKMSKTKVANKILDKISPIFQNTYKQE